jgi:hypothetical protein
VGISTTAWLDGCLEHLPKFLETLEKVAVLVHVLREKEVGG